MLLTKEDLGRKEGKELMIKLEKGLKNKHFTKREREEIFNRYIKAYREINLIEVSAGYYDKKGNIFPKKEIGELKWK